MGLGGSASSQDPLAVRDRGSSWLLDLSRPARGLGCGGDQCPPVLHLVGVLGGESRGLSHRLRLSWSPPTLVLPPTSTPPLLR